MRKPRKIVQNAEYHVIARANRQEMILASNTFKDLFLEVMRRAKKKYHFICLNFCLMGNHIHLILKPDARKRIKNPSAARVHSKNTITRPESASLSKIMQWILSVFALKFNKICGVKGHVWYDRFHSTVIVNFFNYLKAFIYIMQNPVKAGIVKKPTDYHYNGITFMLKGMIDLFMPE